MPDVDLHGCRTRPLLAYLKALGMFRHVAGRDPEARLWWAQEGHARLRSGFDADGLVRFFLDEYEPSPITSPWNGGSGYYPGDKTEAIERVESSVSPRLRALRETIAAARGLFRGSPPREAEKAARLERWRAVAPEAALPWIDAAIALTVEGPAMNPLLGTGGNDGRFEFSNNFLARLLDCLPHPVGSGERDASAARLAHALLAAEAPLVRAPVGMFAPGTAGLPNSAAAPGAEASLVDPWDFILGLEGALLFAGGSARRLNADQALFPFTVAHVARVGSGLDAGSDARARGETWLPLWHKPASLPALARLFAEGRLQDGRSLARSGRDAVRAVLSLGVDRGLGGFERVVYAQRFGLNFVAAPAGRVAARGVAGVEVTRAADDWIALARRSGGHTLREALAHVERSLVDLATASDERAAFERWLLALADAQLAAARLPAAARPRPLRRLPGQLLQRLPFDPAHRLARVLALVGREPGGVPFRALVEPVVPTRGGSFAWAADRPARGPALRHAEALLATFAEHAAEAPAAPEGAALADVDAFLAGEVDPRRVVRLAYAFSLCEPTPVQPPKRAAAPPALDRLYAAARLASGGQGRRPGGEADVEIPPAPDVVRAAAAGNAAAAARAAQRRLRAAGLVPYPSLVELERDPGQARRLAAALAFPVAPRERRQLEQLVLQPASAPVPTAEQGAPT